VKVLNCVIKVDQFEFGFGIEMHDVKFPVIDNNHIMVGTEGADLVLPLSVQYAWGILMTSCFTAQITNNNIDVHGDYVAIGIEMENCPKSVVGILSDGTPAPNIIDVLAAGDVFAAGIKFRDSPLIRVNCNQVTVEANANTWGAAFGIKGKYSDRSEVNANTVTVYGFNIGGMAAWQMVRGIWIKQCHESEANGNTVVVECVGNTNSTAAMPTDFVDMDDITEDMEDIDEILMDTTGTTAGVALSLASAIGIKVRGSELVDIIGNDVDVLTDLDVVAAGEVALADGTAVAMGIVAKHCLAVRVLDNAVDVDAVEDTFAEAAPGTAEAFGGCLSVAMGIVLFDSPVGTVAANEVRAEADQRLEVKSYGATLQEAGSALALINSEILGAIYQSLSELVEGETVDVDMSGTPPSIESFATGGGLAIGMGILVLGSPGATVAENSPVIGTGDVEVWVLSEESSFPPAIASGGGLGLGVGIAVIGSGMSTVSGNTGVNGTGTADVTVGSLHDMVADAISDGGGAGVGIGILVIGLLDWKVDAEALGDVEDLAEDQCGWLPIVVVGNEVTASGVAMPVTVSAIDQVVSHEAYAYGGALGMALGIAGLWTPGILIQGNMVAAHANACVDVYSEAVHEFDPYSYGGAAALGIGIITVGSPFAKIVENCALGTGEACADVGAHEKVIMDAGAFAGTIGLGVGIMTFDSFHTFIIGNNCGDCSPGAVGLGDADTLVLAQSDIPLGEAAAFGLSFGIGKGIDVVLSPCTTVAECNTAAGEGTARVVAEATADFDYDLGLGVAASLDIAYMLSDWPGRVNYNSMVDVAPIGTNSGPILVLDAGLLFIGFDGPLDARFNWWNDPTGPSGGGPGNGEPLMAPFAPAWFMPWLWVEHCEVLDSQIGKFGFAVHLSKGLNTFSTPIALEETEIPSRRWEDIVANSSLAGELKFADRWDPATQTWVALTADTLIDPLDAIYLYTFEDCHSVILMVNSSPGHPYAMPQRQLYAGWNLIGPNPIFPEPGMLVGEALASALVTPDDLPGITQVISPVADLHHQEPWHWVPSMGMDARFMESGLGYWAWSLNPVILPGFGFTPLPHFIDLYGHGGP
jgi:hypothetical protein